MESWIVQYLKLGRTLKVCRQGNIWGNYTAASKRQWEADAESSN